MTLTQKQIDLMNSLGVTPGSQAVNKAKTPEVDSNAFIARIRNKAGVKSEDIIEEKVKKQGFFDKTAELTDKTLGKAANFMFGSTAKAAGTAITGGISGVAEALGKEKVFGADVQKLKEQEQQITPTDIAFTALELYPGGGFVSKFLKELPGGVKVAEYLSKLPEGMKKQALEKYASIFNATSKESKELVKKTVPGLLERGVKITSPGGLAEQAEKKVTQYGENIDKYFENLPANAKEQTKPILDKLVGLKDKYIVEGKVIRQEAVNAIDKTMEKISQFGEEISTESVRKLRQIFDEHYDISKGLDDISAYVKKAERAGANAIREEFAKTRPDLDKLNKEFNFWKNVQDLGTYSAEKAKNKFTKSISSVIGGAVGFQTGEGLGGKATGTVIGAYLGTKAIDLFKSPAWKSISAIEKNKLADAIMRGDMETVNLIISKITAGVKNTVSE